jgi:hypothetical protein
MEFLKEKTAKIPGLSYVVIVATFLLLSKEPTVADAVLILLLSWLFYSAGSGWDKFFDWVYKPRKEPLLTLGIKSLAESREAAARALKRPITGIYKKSKQLFAKSEDWEKHVNTPLQLSKAARTLIIPCILILTYTYSLPSSGQWLTAAQSVLRNMVGYVSRYPSLHWAIEKTSHFLAIQEQRPEGLRWFVAHAHVVTVILILVTILSVWLRIVHMKKLYRLVSHARLSRFAVLDQQNKKREMLSVNERVLAVRTILLCGKVEPRLFTAQQFAEAKAGVDVTAYILCNTEEECRFPVQLTEEEISEGLFESSGEDKRKKKIEIPILPNDYISQCRSILEAPDYHWDQVVTIVDAPKDWKKTENNHWPDARQTVWHSSTQKGIGVTLEDKVESLLKRLSVG